MSADPSVPFIVAELDCGSDRNAVSKAIVALRETCPNTAVLLATRDEESVVIMTSAPKGGKIHAGDWAKAIVGIVGGKGGGAAESGQATGSKPSELPAALAAAKEYAAKK